ncbi:MAG: hypothetical protein K1W16_05145 [Lachnospiraceae bacterium]
MFNVSIYIETDNGSRKKLYRGYGAAVEYIRKNRQRESRIVSGICYGTWNLAYILALTEALNLLNSPCTVKIYSDNEHVCESISNGRVNDWRRNGWRTAKGEPIANTEEWRTLYRASSKHELHYMHSTGKSAYSVEIQDAIKEVRNKGEYYQASLL